MLPVWQGFITNGEVPVEAASVTVFKESDGLQAVIYDNPEGTGSPLTQPLLTPPDGYVRFYVAGGIEEGYRVRAEKGLFFKDLRNVPLGQAAAYNVIVDFAEDPLLSAKKLVTREVADILYAKAKGAIEAGVDPTVNDDDTLGYSIGSRWLNSVSAVEFVCLDPSAGAAVWLQVGLSEAAVQAIADGAVADHVALANPHAQYLLIADLGTYLPNWFASNNGANFAAPPAAAGANAQAWGNAASAPDADQIAIGNGATLLAGGIDSMAIGKGANTGTSTSAIAIGADASVGGTGVDAIAMGHNAATAGQRQIAVGEGATITSTGGGICIVGSDNVARTQAVMFGDGNVTSAGGQTSVLLGRLNDNNSTGGNPNYCTVLVGVSCQQATGSLSSGVAIGQSITLASSGGVGIGGFNYNVNFGAVTINAGTNGGNVSADYAVNIGMNCDSIGTGAVHIGGSNSNSGAGAAGAYSVAMGYKVDCDGVYGIAIGEQANNNRNNTAVIGGRVGVPTMADSAINFPNWDNAVANRNRVGMLPGTRIATTDDTPVVRLLSRMAASQFATLEVWVASYEAATGDFCVRRCTLNVVSNSSENITIVGTPVIGAAEKTGTMETAVSFGASLTQLQVTLTGEAAKNIVTSIGGRFIGASV